MAKRTNILTTIDREIKNGKTYIDNNGFFVNAEAVEKDKKEAYLKALKENPSLIDKGVTLADFEQSSNTAYRKADEVFKQILAIFNEQTLFITPEQPEQPEQATETEPETKEEKQPTKPENKGKKN